MIRITRVLTLAALLLAALPWTARADHWTAVGSTGTIDEANITPAVNFAFSGPALSFLGNATGSITARYNVSSSIEFPTWNQLELGNLDTNNLGSITATLIRVTPCNGAQQIICAVTSTDNPTGPKCNSCTFGVGIDFTQFLYYVEVRMNRSSPNAPLQTLTLRIF
jgi:hypothetical protein